MVLEPNVRVLAQNLRDVILRAETTAPAGQVSAPPPGISQAAE
jgi:hypothetical protein